MAGIQMCSGKGCPMRHSCRRFTADPDPGQWYFDKPPIEDGECDFYWTTGDDWGWEGDM